MTYHDYCASFLNMEMSAGEIVSDIMHEDLNLWQYIHFTYLQSYFYRKAHLRSGKKECAIKKEFRLPQGLYRLLLKIPPMSVLLWTRSQVHCRKLEGKLYDPYLDQFYVESRRIGLMPIKINVDTAPIEDAFYPVLNVPILNSHIKDVEISDFINGHYKKYRFLCRDFNVQVLTASEIMTSYFTIEGYRSAIERILDIIRPRLVVLEAYFSNELMLGLVHACRNLAIPCVEIQHGLQTWPHMGFNFGWLPERGWDLLPEWFFVWGKGAKKDLARWLRDQIFHKVLITGQPLYAAWKKGDYREDAETLKKFDECIAGRVPICVPLPLFEAEDRIPLLRDIILSSPQEWIWLLRKHPLHPKSIEVEALQDLEGRIETDLSTTLNLHDVLVRSRHVVVGASSSAYEALSLHRMRVTTITEPGRIYYNTPIFKGFVNYATGVDEALASIKRGINGYPWCNYDYMSGDETLLGKSIRIVTDLTDLDPKRGNFE